MTCPYYTWKNNFFSGDYYCTAKDESVPTDTYQKFCKNYDYSDCPIYKRVHGSSGGCYLTSACIIAKNLPDNCYELETLRHFRDHWLMEQENGIQLIADYYAKAPKIVSAINEDPNKISIYNQIYSNLILPCLRYIENNQFEEAKELYQATTLNLYSQFVN